MVLKKKSLFFPSSDCCTLAVLQSYTLGGVLCIVIDDHTFSVQKHTAYITLNLW